ncbi:Rieske 2Fe-2S domain-containing protein [Chelatococcus sambhunathii]|uniref:Rieske 2Fe-2S domain-containing protein n=1 Tax=Chelatococcus sambhunathii TaxID=363953 RepID=A0ABU1DD21_9HYPH|nr:Rieske 2Fe-2S domain-containing protein [Chelatococcus sambhunathii]MDR4306001.1 Rieske 2Fe-2S domain-containing protein [Chelatococcus sambhunathii]
MLITRQKVLRRFWYATEKLENLKDGPKPFTLLGEKLVLFIDGSGEPAALMDRCCHRTAKLSKGWCDKGLIVCGYHGWSYDRTGQLIDIPQFSPEQVVPRLGVKSYRCKPRYGYAWVCLDEPLADIPEVPEDSDPSFRRIMQFHDDWETSAFRLMENSFDNAHFAFVHRSTFGQIDQPIPEKYEIRETDYGFEAETIVTIANPPQAHRVTGSKEPTTRRHMRNKWFMPFARRLDIEYPSGLRHIIINSATPVDDGRIKLAQILYRNDDEASCSTEELIAWDQVIVEEDRDILESTDPDATMDMARKVESHMPSDRPGMIMRKRLLKLLRDHGEDEISEAVPAVSWPFVPTIVRHEELA